MVMGLAIRNRSCRSQQSSCYIKLQALPLTTIPHSKGIGTYSVLQELCLGKEAKALLEKGL